MSTRGPWPGGAVAPAPAPADVGIVAALPIEVGFLTDKLTSVRKYRGPGHSIIEGEHEGKLVALIVGGMGRVSARNATELLIAGHHPRVIVSAGFGGALDPSLKRNDLVFFSEIRDQEGQTFVAELPACLPDSTRIKTGRLLTVDAIVRTAAEKAELRARFDADVTDMETSAVASVCNKMGLKFIALRIVSDDANIDLPPEIATLMTRSGGYRVGAALRAIWNRPSAIKDFWTLHENAQEAADWLAEVTLALIAGLKSDRETKTADGE